MRFKRLRNWFVNKIACPDNRLILEENKLINELITAKAFTGIGADDKMYLDGEPVPKLICMIFHEYKWEHFPTTGGMCAISHLQVLTHVETGKFFVGRMVVYLNPDEGLALETLTKDSDYFDTEEALYQGISPKLLDTIKSLITH
jgi:hypothetical protein